MATKKPAKAKMSKAEMAIEKKEDKLAKSLPANKKKAFSKVQAKEKKLG
jgi:hypothetical protein